LAAGIIGAICVVCGMGRVFAYRDKVIIRVVGQPLFRSERHIFEQRYCRLCGAIFTAEGAELVVRSGIGSGYVTYAWSACAMLIVMHYFAGAPFKRLEALHQGWGVPMPDANQWRIADECDDLLAPLYMALERHAIRNATSLGFDDTGSMIIELRRQIHACLRRHLDHRTPPTPHIADSNPTISGVCSNTRSVTPDPVSISAMGRGLDAAGAHSSSREYAGTDLGTPCGSVLVSACSFVRATLTRNSRARSTRVTPTTAGTPCIFVAWRARASSCSGTGSRACFFLLRHCANADLSSFRESTGIV
jgi:hypothetical protein